MPTDNPPSQFAFETERLRMRPLAAEDEALFCFLYTDTDTMRFIGEPLSPEQAVRSFRKLISAPRGSAPQNLFLTILEKASQRTIGLTAISQFDARMTRAEVGIVLESNARSRGYAREGLGGLVKQTFRAFPVDEIWVQCSALNPVVERMVGSIGFKLSDGSAVEIGPLSQRIWSVHRSSWCSNNATNNLGENNVERHRLS